MDVPGRALETIHQQAMQEVSNHSCPKCRWGHLNGVRSSGPESFCDCENGLELLAKWNSCDTCHGEGTISIHDPERGWIKRFCDCPRGQELLEKDKRDRYDRYIESVRHELPPKLFEMFQKEFKQETKKQKNLWTVATDYGKSFQPGDGLILSGPVGCGKTHLAVKVFSAFMRIGRKARFESFGRLMQKIRNEPGYATNYLGGYDLIFLDELSIEYATDYYFSEVQRLFEMFYGYKTGLLITTNISFSEIGKLLGQRVESRLSEMCQFVSCDGMADYRKIGKEIVRV